ncbi:hypothetical protein QOZ80_2BG0175640 [Eleusine coracana subsp. coracana]|nr:hypothetical protein QOZ80_2BG0175640 [Eleusine coracana subsp. coracana]
MESSRGGEKQKRHTFDHGETELRMVARGSSMLNRLVAMASSMKKKASPKCGGARRTASLPQVQQRAYWNPVMGNIVKEFHDKNQYARYGRLKIQEKERELKRDYKMLKDALKQSACSWDHERFMIQAEPHLWDNLIVSFPKIKKFRNPKATFPLFHAVGELYDGHLAEGNYNFTSLGFPEDEEAPKKILVDAEDEVQVLDDIQAEEVHGEDPNVQQMEEDLEVHLLQV